MRSGPGPGARRRDRCRRDSGRRRHAGPDVTDTDDPDSTDADDATDAEDASDTADVPDANDTSDAADLPDAADTTEEVDATPVCGNGVLEPGEQCDRGELDGQTCVSLGLTEGLLTCGADCTFRTGRCAICSNALCEGAEDLTICPSDCHAIDVAVGREHSCVALADGSVRCWGARTGLRAGGLGDTGVPTTIEGLEGLAVVEVAAGDAHTCVRTDEGEVWCWGRNGFGESAPDIEDVEIWPPRRVEGLPPTQALALGLSHACAVASGDGTVWCWGRSVFGALGRPVEDARRAIPEAVDFGAETHVDAVAAGADHTCAWQNGGKAWCWGRSDQHQVGGLDSTWHFGPRQVSTNALIAGTGSNHSCATLLNLLMPPQFSGLFCWGSNAYGQLGSEPTDDYIGAQRISATRPARLDGGDGFTCTLDGSTGEVSCWGANESGQLGDGTLAPRFAPAATAPLGGRVGALDAGARHVCALIEGGGVRCWGDNRFGQIGVDTVLETHASPVAPIGFGGAP